MTASGAPKAPGINPATIVLLGAEANAEIEHATAERGVTTAKPKGELA